MALLRRIVRLFLVRLADRIVAVCLCRPRWPGHYHSSPLSKPTSLSPGRTGSANRVQRPFLAAGLLEGAKFSKTVRASARERPDNAIGKDEARSKRDLDGENETTRVQEREREGEREREKAALRHRARGRQPEWDDRDAMKRESEDYRSVAERREWQKDNGRREKLSTLEKEYISSQKDGICKEEHSGIGDRERRTKRDGG